MEYILNLTNFSGTIELLFYSVKKGETDIYNISLTEIVTQYIQYIQKLLEIDIDKVAEFLVYSAALIELKSKKLLPVDKEEKEDEEEISEEEMKKLLQERMEEYRKYKEISERFRIWEENMKKIHFRGVEPEFSIEKEISLEDVSIIDLFIIFKNILERSKEVILEIFPERITVEDRIREIKEIVKEKKVINFFQLFPEEATKIEVIVTFLAILELIRQKFIKIRQTKIFGEIDIYLNDGETGIQKYN